MNEAMKNIYERRSVRSFLPKQITKGELVTVLDAGMQAPSAMNRQSWFVLGVQNAEYVEEIRKLCVKTCEMKEDANPFYSAPTIVLVFGKADNGNSVRDGSLAMQNMMLAAHSIGLGSVWINCVNTAFSTEEGQAFAKKMGLPEGYAPVGSLAVGLPDGSKPREKVVEKKYLIVE